MSKATWHYAKNRQKAGPVSLDSLKKKLSLGELGSDALVWTVGWESWKKVCDVPELTVPEPPPLPPEEPPSLPVEKPPIAKESDQGEEGSSEKCVEAPDGGPSLPYSVSIHGERPENYVLLTTDKQWVELLRRSKTITFSDVLVSPVLTIRNIRGTLVPQESYGLVVEPAKEGADRLKRFFGGRRMLDFRAEENPPTPSGVVSATPQTPEHTHQPHKANASGDKMITMKKISILIIMVGLLLPVVSLGFVDRYNPIRGFIWNISNMEIISIPYGYVLALGGILICLGTAGVLFDSKPIDRISRRDERAGGEQAKTEERKPEIPAENKTSPDVLPDSDLE